MPPAIKLSKKLAFLGNNVNYLAYVIQQKLCFNMFCQLRIKNLF